MLSLYKRFSVVLTKMKISHHSASLVPKESSHL